MKTKLLKKLRRKFSKKYSIRRHGTGWAVWYGTFNTSYSKYNTLDQVKEYFIMKVRNDIYEWLYKQREKHIPHSIKYYPW